MMFIKKVKQFVEDFQQQIFEETKEVEEKTQQLDYVEKAITSLKAEIAL